MIGKLHHLGVASRNIGKDAVFYGLLGYAPAGEPREDVAAGIRVQFLSAEGQPDIELVQNLAKDGPVTPHLQARRKVFHVAYETDDIAGDAQRLVEEQGAVWLVPITRSDAPEMGAWCYLACRNMLILELVQTRKRP